MPFERRRQGQRANALMCICFSPHGNTVRRTFRATAVTIRTYLCTYIIRFMSAFIVRCVELKVSLVAAAAAAAAAQRTATDSTPAGDGN